MPESLTFSETLMIGSNEHGYSFGVGLLSDRWLGFSIGDDGNVLPMLFVMPEISEDFQLGIPDRDRCIRMAGAIAQDPERNYGGISTWLVAEDLRGDPEDFRCPLCREVCCGGCEDYYGDDFQEGP